MKQLIQANSGDMPSLCLYFSILNSVFHIIESFLSQEELPDFYEEKLAEIADILIFVIQSNFSSMPRPPPEVVKCKAKAVRVVHYYQFKFNEFVQNYS